MLIPNTPSIEEISIAPGERKQPCPLLADQNCEPLAFLYLSPAGKFGYRVKRDKKLIPVKYFNQHLLNFSQLLTSSAYYIFYALSVTQKLKMNIALEKVCSDQITAGILTNNFSETVKSFLCEDDAYQFMGTIKGTPAYWKK